MGRTPKVVEDRRDQILDAAMSVFSTKGFGRTTNKDIARQAGITSGLIYYYFKSKEDLLQAIAETRSPLHLMRSLPAQALETPPAQLLPFLIPQMLEIVENEASLQFMRIFLPELLYQAGLAEPLRTKLLGEFVGYFVSYYARQKELGHIRSDVDPTFLAQITVSCLMGFVMRRDFLCDSTVTHYSHQELATLMTRTILSGIEAR